MEKKTMSKESFNRLVETVSCPDDISGYETRCIGISCEKCISVFLRQYIKVEGE